MQNNELFHYGIKGQKWGIIRKTDDQDNRLSAEKNRLKYDYLNREAKMFYENQNKKDKQDYKRALKLAKIEKQINRGKDLTTKALSRDKRLGEKYKANAQAISAVSKALAFSSVGKSFALAAQSGGIGNVTNKYDNRSNYSENKSKVNIGNTTTQAYSKGLISMANAKKKSAFHSLDLSELVSNNDVLVSSLEVEHSGILGQKWGIRRFQDKNGKLTEEGRLRYYGYSKYKDININNSIKELNKEFESSEEFKTMNDDEKQKKYKEIKNNVQLAATKIMADEEAKLRRFKEEDEYALTKIDAGKQVIFSAGNIATSSANLIPNVPGKSEHPDYADISTEELIRRTNRLNAENNYARAAGEMIYTPSKQEMTRERLQTIGAVLGIVGAATGGIILPLSKVKHWNGGGGKS